ncbi:NAD(P)-binding domain-containing protein [Atlantibacter subterranea]|uniref:NADPH-dependent F420 reductase n=1 Tax=Atlantibacter subterraneus TaxID=255519 RepID=UPI0020C2AF01|nr:NAD(P)-binding domain-containing protein [Atlantibacter subterranea]UTJ49506.1 NAD(P)-binding domain-containing protein [Atlantibacter subterranea]
MKIGIIGAGFVGRTIGKLATSLGHQVMLSNSRGPQSLFSLPHATGCQIGTVEDAIAFSDITVVAIPLSALYSVPVEPLAGKIVVDANNYYPERDGHIAELDNHATTTSELLAEHLPSSYIVKAFNAITMNDLETDGLPPGTPNRRALPIAGDDPESKAIVATLLDEFGFDVCDTGPLSEGWRFERDRPVYCVSHNLKQLMDEMANTVRDNR